jgi:hypothetical protein
VIRRIRRVLDRYDLDPIALGLPPIPGGTDAGEFPDDCADASNQEQPLLDFGDARDDSFFPELKAASVQSRIPCGPGMGRPLKRLIDPDLAGAFDAAGWSGQRVPAPLVAGSDGFSLHAATLIRKGQRDQLEKLCRYSREPAICLKRLEVRSDGLMSWSLPKAWRDGTKGFILTPYQFIARLAAIVPHPREHQLTYQGVLAPASPLRDQLEGVRKAWRNRAVSAGGGDPSSPALGRSPPAKVDAQIPMPLLQGRLDFGE